MKTRPDQSQENRNRSVADYLSQKKTESFSPSVTSRPQSKLQEMASNSPQALQMKAIQQMADNRPQQVIQLLTDEELESWSEMSEEDVDWMTAKEKEQLGKYKSGKAADKKRAADWQAALDSRKRGMSCVSWDYNGKNYHINLRLGEYHVTEEASPKIHYFFKGFGEDISDQQSGNKGKHDKVFTELPNEVQNFIRENFSELLL